MTSLNARQAADDEAMNPYWAAWLRAHLGQKLPTYEFLIWMNRRWREFEAAHGMAENQPKTNEDRHQFGVWLDRLVDAQRVAVA